MRRDRRSRARRRGGGRSGSRALRPRRTRWGWSDPSPADSASSSAAIAAAIASGAIRYGRANRIARLLAKSPWTGSAGRSIATSGRAASPATRATRRRRRPDPRRARPLLGPRSRIGVGVAGGGALAASLTRAGFLRGAAAMVAGLTAESPSRIRARHEHGPHRQGSGCGPPQAVPSSTEFALLRRSATVRYSHWYWYAM